MKNNLDLKKLSIDLLEKIESLFNENKKLLIACSGGIDSVFLVSLICSLFSKKDPKRENIAIVHVNYGLRDIDSDMDEKFVKDLASSEGLGFYLLKAHTDKHEGIQDWARKIRYNFFEKLSCEHNAVVAVAHHMNDVAENILFRLTRGSSISNLSGMQENYSYIWRPLLNISRAQIKEYIEQNGISYREDRTNSVPKYARNIIRLNIIPQLESMYPRATERIVHAVSDAKDIVEYTRSILIKDLSKFKNNKIPVGYLKKLNDGTAFLLFKILLDNLGGKNFQISRTNFSSFLDKIRSNKRNSRIWTHDLSHGFRICYNKGFVFIEKTKEE